MPLYDYVCAHGHSVELRQPMEVAIVQCELCGEEAWRVAVHYFGFSGFARTPVADREYGADFKRFTEASAELDYKHGRLQESAGRPLPTPPLFRRAVSRAAELQRLGVRDSAEVKP